MPTIIRGDKFKMNASALDVMLEHLIPPYIPPDGYYRAFARYVFVQEDQDNETTTSAEGNPDTDQASPGEGANGDGQTQDATDSSNTSESVDAVNASGDSGKAEAEDKAKPEDDTGTNNAAEPCKQKR